MTELAGTDAAGRAAVDDQPDPDPGAHGHIGEILKAPAAAPADFGQRGTVDVGVETDRHGESRLQRSEQIGALPVALVRRADAAILAGGGSKMPRGEGCDAEAGETGGSPQSVHERKRVVE